MCIVIYRVAILLFRNHRRRVRNPMKSLRAERVTRVINRLSKNYSFGFRMFENHIRY